MVVVVNELFVGVVDRIVVVYVVVGYASNCDKFCPSFVVCFCSETHRERKILRASERYHLSLLNKRLANNISLFLFLSLSVCVYLCVYFYSECINARITICLSLSYYTYYAPSSSLLFSPSTFKNFLFFFSGFFSPFFSPRFLSAFVGVRRCSGKLSRTVGSSATNNAVCA